MKMASADKWMMVLFGYDHSIPNFLSMCLKNFWSLRNWLLNASFKMQETNVVKPSIPKQLVQLRDFPIADSFLLIAVNDMHCQHVHRCI